MTDDRPAQPGPPGDPPNPPGGRPVEERMAVVETRLDDLPTKGDLAKTERRVGKLAIKLHTALIGHVSALTQQVGSLHEALRGQITTYIMIVGIMVSAAVFFLDLRERDRQKVVEDVQQVQKAQGETLKAHGELLESQQKTLEVVVQVQKAHGELLKRMDARQDRQEEMLGQIREEVRANREQMEANREEVRANREQMEANREEVRANREQIQANQEEMLQLLRGGGGHRGR